MRLAQTIRTLRDARGLTVTALALQAGISDGALHQIEAGVREPRDVQVLRLAHALKVSVGLLRGEADGASGLDALPAFRLLRGLLEELSEDERTLVCVEIARHVPLLKEAVRKGRGG